MADFQINPNGYRPRQRQNPAPKAASTPPSETRETAEKPRQEKPSEDTQRERRPQRDPSPAEQRLDQYRRLVNRMEEANRRRLEEQRRMKPPEKKKLSYEEIRIRVMAIRSRLRKGGRLTGAEKIFLANNAPGELEKLLRAERERSAFKARLSSCQSKEEAELAFQGACTSALSEDISDPDFSSVLIGQFAAALREMSDKPTEAQLEKQNPEGRLRLNHRA